MIYIVLTITSLLGKLAIFKFLRKIYNGSRLHQLVNLLVCIFLLQSSLELGLYYFASMPSHPAAYWFLVGMYCCLLSLALLLPFIALATTNTPIKHYVLFPAIAITVAIIGLLLTTRLIISDVQYIEVTHSLTRVAGDYYFIFQAASLISILSTLGIFAAKSFDPNFYIRTRSINLCLAFIPVCFFMLFILIGMAYGMQFNAVGIAPILFLIYTAALVHNLDNKQQPDYLVLLPFTRKNKILIYTLNRLVYAEPSINRKTLDEQLIDYYLSQSGLTQKDVAKILNMSEATLSRRKRQTQKKSSPEKALTGI